MVPADSSGVGQSSAFHTTHWSVVMAAAGREAAGEACEPGPDRQRAALEHLLGAYWYPVYAFARRRGQAAEDARDLVQSFFTGLLENGDLASADQERGRFRSFLLTCFQNFASNQRDREQALKRGGGQAGFSLDQALAEQRFGLEPSTDQDAEHAFNGAWARALMEQVLAQLGAEYGDKGKDQVFQQLKPMLEGDLGAASYARMAASLGISEGAVKVAAHRLRKRFGELLRREISHTVQSPEDIEDEIRGLFEALA